MMEKALTSLVILIGIIATISMVLSSINYHKLTDPTARHKLWVHGMTGGSVHGSGTIKNNLRAELNRVAGTTNALSNTSTDHGVVLTRHPLLAGTDFVGYSFLKTTKGATVALGVIGYTFDADAELGTAYHFRIRGMPTIHGRVTTEIKLGPEGHGPPFDYVPITLTSLTLGTRRIPLNEVRYNKSVNKVVALYFDLGFNPATETSYHLACGETGKSNTWDATSSVRTPKVLIKPGTAHTFTDSLAINVAPYIPIELVYTPSEDERGKFCDLTLIVSSPWEETHWSHAFDLSYTVQKLTPAETLASESVF